MSPAIPPQDPPDAGRDPLAPGLVPPGAGLVAPAPDLASPGAGLVPLTPNPVIGLSFEEMFAAGRKLAVRRACTRLSADEAEDLVQDVAIGLYERWPTMPPEQRTVAWFLGKVQFRIREVARRTARREARHTSVLPTVPREPDDDIHRYIDEGSIESVHSMSSGQATRALQRMLDKQPERQRDAWMYYHWNGWPVQWIADRMRISVKTVRNYIARADAALRQEAAGMGLRFELFAGGRARRVIGTIPPPEPNADDKAIESG